MRPFLETLRELRRGATLEELAVKLQELTLAVVQTGKPGELVMKLKLAPAGAKGAALIMTDVVAVKLPQVDQGSTVFFPTTDGELSRSDPNQLSLRLQGVPQQASVSSFETGTQAAAGE